MRIGIGGRDSTLKAEHSEIYGSGGPVLVSGESKALVEIKEVMPASGRGDLTVSLSGSSSLLKAELAYIASQGGNVNLRAGDNGWWAGVELIETTDGATGGIRVHGSLAGRYGTVKAATSAFSGGADIRLPDRSVRGDPKSKRAPSPLPPRFASSRARAAHARNPRARRPVC